jgi:hypothetical protein
MSNGRLPLAGIIASFLRSRINMDRLAEIFPAWREALIRADFRGARQEAADRAAKAESPPSNAPTREEK